MCNLYIVHSTYKSCSLYKPCLRALKNKCSPFGLYCLHCSAKCTIYTLCILPTNRTVYINLVCVHLKINVVPLAFTVYIVLQNVQIVHCALYKSYSLYTLYSIHLVCVCLKINIVPLLFTL